MFCLAYNEDVYQAGLSSILSCSKFSSGLRLLQCSEYIFIIGSQSRREFYSWTPGCFQRVGGKNVGGEESWSDFYRRLCRGSFSSFVVCAVWVKYQDPSLSFSALWAESRDRNGGRRARKGGLEYGEKRGGNNHKLARSSKLAFLGSPWRFGLRLARFGLCSPEWLAVTTRSARFMASWARLGRVQACTARFFLQDDNARARPSLVGFV